MWPGHGGKGRAVKKGEGKDTGVYMWVNDEGTQAEAGAGSGNQ